MANRRPVMLVENAGSGKTVFINNKLASLDGDETLVTTIPLNYYTNSMMLQQVTNLELVARVLFNNKHLFLYLLVGDGEAFGKEGW